VLFVPVSGPVGSGEYQRCLMLARGLAARGASRISFVVADAAPYADRVPFPVTRVPGSTTRASAEVIAAIRDSKPAVVVFDSGGRAAQWRAARDCGARVAYVSSRASSYARALRWRRLALLDLHWHVAPADLAPVGGAWERFKRRLLPRAHLFRSDAWFEPPGPRPPGVDPPYVLLVAGGGAQRTALGDADDLFAAAAARIGAAGFTAVQVGRPRDPAPGTVALPPLPNAILAALVRDATVVVCGAGSLLVQALALGAPAIACALQAEQQSRLAWGAARGAVDAVAADPEALSAAALALATDPPRRAARADAARALGLSNGLAAAIDELIAVPGVLSPTTA
jgi:hypothetical protein